MPRTERTLSDNEKRVLAAFAARLRTLREERSWSFGQAETASGVTRSYWRRLETGKHQPGLLPLLRIQQAFGLASLENLFGPLPSQRLIDDLASTQGAAPPAGSDLRDA
jgi:transcriptional regulator with XRE-family HTH domain